LGIFNRAIPIPDAETSLREDCEEFAWICAVNDLPGVSTSSAANQMLCEGDDKGVPARQDTCVYLACENLRSRIKKWIQIGGVLQRSPIHWRIREHDSKTFVPGQPRIRRAHGIKELLVHRRVPRQIHRPRCVVPDVTEQGSRGHFPVHQISINHRLEKRIAEIHDNVLNLSGERRFPNERPNQVMKFLAAG
jgi:hypothetical protein